MKMKVFVLLPLFSIFLMMFALIVHESVGFTAGIGANVPGRKRSEFKVRRLHNLLETKLN